MFDFDAFHANDPTEVAHLAGAAVVMTDGHFGHISHLLVAPGTDQAEWALVVDTQGDHHAIPVHLLDEDEDLVRVGLSRGFVESLLTVADPDQTSERRMTELVTDLLVDLRVPADDAGEAAGEWVATITNASIDPGILSGADVYSMLSLVDHARGATAPPPPSTSGGGFDPDSLPPAVTVPADVRDDESAAPGSVTRSLVAELPRSVEVGNRFSVQVLVVVDATDFTWASGLSAFAGGETVTVNATVPASFRVHGELTQDLAVPLDGDSTPALFTFTPAAIGSFPLRFTAFSGGSYLGKLEVEVSVAHETSGTSREVRGSLSTQGARPGEVSLQITFEPSSNTFRFLLIAANGDRREVPSLPIEGDIRTRIEGLVPEFDSYARNDSGLSPAEAQQRMRVHGFELWRDLVPGPIKAAILDHLDDISQLTIYCDREIVPWELLYPQTATGDQPGFLVGLFPVNRWVMASPWSNRLSLDKPMFVLPDPSPRQAEVEVAEIARRLNAAPTVPLKTRQQVLRALEQPQFSSLHFACHNLYTPERGSMISFVDGAFTPSDLVLGAAGKPLRDTQSLVFLNACRTQGSRPVYTSLENWAKNFLGLGATAVIGTSWAVRDRTAQPFADTVYRELRAGRTLGEAVAGARTEASTVLGDSTWLAYTVYGDPTARVEAR